MIVFQRVITFEGPPQDVVPWAMEMTDAVNSRTDVRASLWQGLFGGPIGSLGWSCLVDSLTSLEVAMDALATDPAYLALVARAQPWLATPGEDSLLRMVHTSGGEYVRPSVGGYAETITATPAEGHLADAMTFGVEMADVHADLTHSSVLFCTSAYGGFGELRWMALYDSAAAVDRAAEVIAKDEDYGRRLDAAGTLFTPGTGRRTLARRLA